MYFLIIVGGVPGARGWGGGRGGAGGGLHSGGPLHGHRGHRQPQLDGDHPRLHLHRHRGPHLHIVSKIPALDIPASTDNTPLLKQYKSIGSNMWKVCQPALACRRYYAHKLLF